MPQFFGKYRGKVENNLDPLELARVQVSVPAVRGEGSLAWAMPCLPYAGPGVGLFLVPPVGANVWVEFEGGNPDFPIVGGCFWDEYEVPVDAKPTMRAFVSDGIELTIDDASKDRLKLTVFAPITDEDVSFVIDSEGRVTVAVGTSTLEISASEVKINGEALVVR